MAVAEDAATEEEVVVIMVITKTTTPTRTTRTKKTSPPERSFTRRMRASTVAKLDTAQLHVPRRRMMHSSFTSTTMVKPLSTYAVKKRFRAQRRIYSPLSTRRMTLHSHLVRKEPMP